MKWQLRNISIMNGKPNIKSISPTFSVTMFKTKQELGITLGVIPK